jgi:membrane-associated phospholipid phosphatase
MMGLDVADEDEAMQPTGTGSDHRDDEGAARPSTTTAERVDKVVDAVVGAEQAVEQVVDKRAARVWTPADSVRVTIALATLLVSGIVASTGVSTPEARTFELINSAPSPLYPVIWPVMQLGNVWVAMAVAACLGLIVRKPKATIILAAAPFTAWLVAKVVKEVVHRGRPEALGMYVHPDRGPGESGFGFISGHATVAFALAGALIPHLRKPWNYVVFGLAAVVALARIYVGAHLPLDVIGGAATGFVIGELARLIETRRTRPKAMRPSDSAPV